MCQTTIFDKIYLVPNKTDAHLENDIVRETDKREVCGDREGESRSESERETVRFLRERTELGDKFCEGLNIRV